MKPTFEEVMQSVAAANKLAKEFARPDQEIDVALTLRTLSYAECKAKGIPVE
jgi:hypothetical protein